MNKKYAGFPAAAVYEDIQGADGKKKPGRKKVSQLLWGDLLDLQDQTHGKYARVRVRVGEGSKRIYGWMKKAEILDDPLLEVTFVDIGQGDGCLVITPDGRQLVIDAGEKDNMKRYLRWRFMFPSEARPIRLHAAVISHPDQDHYLGFKHIFKMPGVTFEKVYHNGLVERKTAPMLGPRTRGEPKLYTDLVKTTRRLRSVLEADAQIEGTKKYPDMLRAALQEGKFGTFGMLSRDDGYMHGFGKNDTVKIQVLGPVVEKQGSKRGLRDFGDDGLTKNGHSVVLRLQYGNVKMLLGGDLNIPSEKLLLETIVGRTMPGEGTKSREDYIKKAREKLQVDIAKSCHHGSADFSSLFLEAVNPVATVISSGDTEKHSHPRPDTLGAIGVNSRGARPLIYSTELARSAKEAIRDPRAERREIKRLHEAVLKAADKAKTTKKKADRDKQRKAETRFRKKVDEIINRTVQTFGAIYVRTDGTKVVLAQKFETSSAGKQWVCSILEPNEDGELCFTSEHEAH